MPRKKKLIALSVFLALVFSLIIFIRFQYVVPIVMYHSVHPNAAPENRLSVSTHSFERQMRFLKEHNYNVVTLQTIAALISEKKGIPKKTIAITLDDGYKDNYIYAFPILKKYNLPATVFLIYQEVSRPQNDRLNWGEIKEMQDSGLVTFGSHCIGPEPLVNITSEEVLRKEVFLSKEILEERLGAPVTAFSYPEGRFNDKIKQLVKEAGYKVAVATNPGKDFADSDIFALKRMRISSTSDNLFVFWFETSGYYNFLREHRHK